MAIGSLPEIGAHFRTGLWTAEEMREWRELVGSDLLGGYAILGFPDREKYAISEFAMVPYIDTPPIPHREPR
jgi:hypothetical protein